MLVFGYSGITEKFIDFAFEMAQVSGYKLNITVVSDDTNAKNKYLEARPAFRKFFSVDDEVVDDDYGILSFNTITFGNIEDDISEILLNDEGNKYAYLFIGSDSNDLNSEIAKVCADCRDLLDANFVINCVTENGNNENGINYVHRDDSIKNHKDYKTLKSMAFNCHLVWNNSELLDIRKLQREFNSYYFFNSSFNNVLSIKYKLISIGVDFDSPYAAAHFFKIVRSANEREKSIIADLIAAEHRRWNVNMICQGYQAPDTLYKYITGEQSKKKQYHPCLVRSSNKIALTYEWRKDNHQMWDKAKENDLEKLDELDRMSVNLHRAYKKRADEIRKKSLLSQADVSEIDKMLEKYSSARKAFKDYIVCLQEINSGSSRQTQFYRYNKSNLNKAIGKLPLTVSKIVRKRIATIDETFAPIIESQKYVDYKQYDKDLIMHIPFILSFKTTYHIGIPIGTEQSGKRNQVLFSNIASALVINPSRVTFFFEYTEREFQSLEKAIKYSIRSMESHNIRATVNLCLLSNSEIPTTAMEELARTSSRINKIDRIIFKDEDDLEEQLNEFVRTHRFFALEKNQTNTSKLMYGMRCYRSNPYYEYDSKENCFKCFNGCEELQYLPFKTVLKVSDLFRVNESIDSYNLPDLEQDYEHFWKKYKSGKDSERTWKALCSTLDEINNRSAIIIDDVFSKPSVETEFYIENRSIDGLSRLMRNLSDINPSITFSKKFRSNSIYTVRINAPQTVSVELKKIIANSNILSNPGDVSAVKTGGKQVKIMFDSLITAFPDLSAIESKASKMYADKSKVSELLNSIVEDNYILVYQEKDEPKGRRLSYSSHQIKSLLSQEGKILELYVYYKVLENGGYDEVATSVEVIREKNAENEFDLILTFGTRSMIVECKAQSTLKQEFYDKLFRLNEEYGINSLPVVIADCNPNIDENKRVIEFGERLGIKTVCGNDKLEEIGKILKDLMNSN